MTAHSLDTLTIASKLKAAGFSEGQAEAMTLVLRDSREADLSTLSTKADLSEFKISVRSEFAEFKASVKAEFADVRSEIRQAELRLEAKIEASKADTIKWVVSAIGFQTIVIVGAIFALVRVFRP